MFENLFNKIANYKTKTESPFQSGSSFQKIIDQAPEVITPTQAVTVKPEDKKIVNITWGDIGNALLDFTIRPVARRTEQIRSGTEGREPIKPTTTAEKIVFGKEEIPTLKQERDVYAGLGEKLGLSKGIAGGLGTFGVIGMTVLDLYPGSSGKGKVVNSLVKETSEEVVEGILKKQFTNLSDGVIKTTAPQIAKAKTADEVIKILDQAHGLENTTKTTKIVTSNTVPYTYKDITPSAYGQIGGHRVFSLYDDTLKKSVVYDFNTGLSLGESSKYKNGTRAIEDVKDKMISKAGDESKVSEAITKAHKIHEKDFINVTSDVSQPKVKSSLLQEAKTKNISKEPVKTPEPTSKPSDVELPKSDVEAQAKFQKDISSPDISINTKRYQVAEQGKKLIDDTIESVRPRIEETVGEVLTNKEVREMADETSKFMESVIGREDTKKWLAALQKTNDRFATAVKNNIVDKQFIDDLIVIKSQATNAGRMLQAQKITTVSKTAQEVMINAILEAGKKADDIIEAAKGVDFNNAEQAAEFYRKFIAPSAGEWVDLIRYNSTLSSPKTQFKNIFANLLNTTINPVIEKAIAGGWDFLASKFTGRARKEFSAEAIKYMQAYSKSFKPAWNRFLDVFKGKTAITQLDLKGIPVATTGAKGAIAKVLSVPTRFLEGMDQFFSELVEAGEKAALNYRKSLGGELPKLDKSFSFTDDIAELARKKAEYLLYRQDLFKEGQGYLLDAVDELTSLVMKARNSKNPLISYPAKFTIMFIKTPMNIFKQGIEYSPVGFLTAWGNTAKKEQFIKALYGSAIAIGAGTMIGSGRITFAEPREEKERNMWREAGKQPYSIKIGNKWVSYQYLNPALAFNIAMMAGIDDMIKNGKASDDTSDVILGSVAKYANFLADQSYFKSMGDLFGAMTGDEVAGNRLISNYPQQLIPFRALGGWLARLTDEYQRQVKTDKTGAEAFVDKQIQLLMMNVPGLTEMVPARTNEAGEPIENKNRLFNAFSPVQATDEDPKLAEFLRDYESLKIKKAEQTYKEKQIKESVIPKYQEVQKLIEGGQKRDALKIVNKMTDEEYKAYKSIKAADKRKTLAKNEVEFYDRYLEIKDLVDSGNKKEAYRMLNELTPEEYKSYRSIKTKLE